MLRLELLENVGLFLLMHSQVNNIFALMQLVQMHQVTEYVSGKTGEYLRNEIAPLGAKICVHICAWTLFCSSKLTVDHSQFTSKNIFAQHGHYCLIYISQLYVVQ